LCPWFSGFRGEDLNAIIYQNMPNLHNQYILAERKISQKNGQNCSILSQNVPKFELYKHNDELLTCITGFFMNFELLPILTDYANWFQRRRFKCDLLSKYA
jgi:hypothetical protein